MSQERWSFGWRAHFAGWQGRAIWGLVILVALVARLGLAWSAMSRPIDDPDNYLPLARSLAKGEGFQFNGRATAYRPPLYPLVLAPVGLLRQDRHARIDDNQRKLAFFQRFV